MTTSVAIRLGVEGGAEVKRTLREIGQDGQQAFQGVGAAADQAGAATDRQTARFQRLAQAAREAEAQARAQDNVNRLLGVQSAPSSAARDSATVFELQARAADEAARRAEVLAREMADLRNRFDPLAAAADRYRRTLDDIARAEAGGAISAEAAAAARLRETRSYEDATLKAERTDAARKAAVQASVAKQMVVPDRGADIAAFGQALDDTRAKYSPLFAAQREYLAQLAEIRQAVAVGAVTQREGAAALQTTKDAFAKRVTGMRGAPEGAGAAGEVERLRQELDERYRNAQQYEQATGVIGRGFSSGALTEAQRDRLQGLAKNKYGTDPSQRGLDTYDRLFVKYQATDFGQQVLAGTSPITALAQQGGQLYQQLADREGGLTQGLRQLGISAKELVTPFTVGATAVAAMGAAIAIAAYQANRDQETLKRSLQTTGRSTDATVSQLDALAIKNAETGRVSASTAREIAAGLASTGDIALPVFDTLIQKTADYAKITGQDIPSATAEFARAFSDPAKGVEDLGNKLGGFDDKTRRYIVTLIEQGQKTEAQNALSEAFRAQVAANTEATSKWGDAWNWVASQAGRAWESVKNATGMGVVTARQTLDDLNLQLKNSEQNSPNGQFTRDLRAKRDAAQAAFDKEAAAEAARVANEVAVKQSNRAGDIARAVDPNYARLSQLRKDLAALNEARDNPLARSMAADPQQNETAYQATKRAIESLTDANGKLISVQEMARRQDQLQIDAAKAKTDAEKASVAERQRAFDLIGKTITKEDAQQRIARAGLLSRAQEASKGGSEDKTDEFDRATRSLEDRIRRQEQEAQTYGMGAEAAARYRAETDLLTAAKRAERDVTPQLTAEIKDYADRAAESAKRQEALRDGMRSTDEYRSVGSDGIRTFVRGLGEGNEQGKLLENTLTRIKSRVLDLASDSISDLLFGKRGASDSGLLGGLFSSFTSPAPATGKGGTGPSGFASMIASAKSFLGFSDGGFTGAGDRLEAAGIVHRGEYVLDARTTSRIGVATLDAIRAGKRGFVEGGYVGPDREAFTVPRAAAMAPANSNGPPSISFITPPGMPLKADGPPRRRADGGYDQALRAVEGGLGQRMARGQGPFQGVRGAGYRIG